MATILKNLSEYDKTKISDISKFSFGVVVAEWNLEITNALFKGAEQTLEEHGCNSIIRIDVPGTFELTYGAKMLIENFDVDAVIVLGCVIQGETRHFDFICQGVTHGITTLNLDYVVPVIFGVLTTENMEQAKDRAGGKHGNKGVEAAITAIRMVVLEDRILEDLE